MRSGLDTPVAASQARPRGSLDLRSPTQPARSSRPAACLIVGLFLVLVLPAAPAVGDSDAPAPVGAEPARDRAAPGFTVRKRVRGLDHPWDVQPIGNRRLLITERDSAHLIVAGRGGKRRVKFPSHRVWVSGETGLMSMEIDPGFPRNRRFYTCQGWRKSGGGHDVRVIAWRLNKRVTRARKVDTLVTGIPARTGRHAGCRLLIARNGALLVGTGDAAVGTIPRNLDSLGGKTLRLNRMTGKPWPSNPFINGKGKRRYVLTYGHRNVQGLAQRRDGSLWSAEHGPFRDDEVNKLRAGGDYGWHPVPGYNESVPMTDHSLPGPQVGARWRSGSPTVATSGATFVRGDKWGTLKGTLAVACLKASRVVFLKFGRTGKLKSVRTPHALRKYGRLRSITSSRNGNLLITTDGVPGGDSVLVVRPR
jgi:aldose sugar dehydrogenase